MVETVGDIASLPVNLPLLEGDLRLYAKHGTGQAVKLMVLPKAALATLRPSPARRSMMRWPRSSRSPNRLRPSSPRRRRPASLLDGLERRPALRSPRTAACARAATAPIAYTVLDEPVPVGEASGVYLPYRPSRIIISAARPHPTDLVESLAMGSQLANPSAGLSRADADTAATHGCDDRDLHGGPRDHA